MFGARGFGSALSYRMADDLGHLPEAERLNDDR